MSRLLGVLTIATTLTKNNTDTAVPFALPKTGRLTLQSDTTGVFAELGLGAAFATTADRGQRLVQYTPVSFALGNIQWVLSVSHPGAGTAVIKVFWEPPP